MTGPTTNPIPKGVASRPWYENQGMLDRIRRVEELSIYRGLSNTAIARELGVDPRTVRADMKRLSSVWKADLGENADRLRDRKVQELQNVVRLGLQVVDEDRRHTQAVLYDLPFATFQCPGGVSHGLDAIGQPMPPCSEAHLIELKPFRDVKGSITYRGQGAQALSVVRQALMDIAKLQGLIIDQVAPVDPQGHGLIDQMTNAWRAVRADEPPATAQLPESKTSTTWVCGRCGESIPYERGDAKQWPDGRDCPVDDCGGLMDVEQAAVQSSVVDV